MLVLGSRYTSFSLSRSVLHDSISSSAMGVMPRLKRDELRLRDQRQRNTATAITNTAGMVLASTMVRVDALGAIFTVPFLPRCLPLLGFSTSVLDEFETGAESEGIAR